MRNCVTGTCDHSGWETFFKSPLKTHNCRSICDASALNHFINYDVYLDQKAWFYKDNINNLEQFSKFVAFTQYTEKHVT